MYFNEKDDKFHSGSEERIRVTFERFRSFLIIIDMSVGVFFLCLLHAHCSIYVCQISKLNNSFTYWKTIQFFTSNT